MLTELLRPRGATSVAESSKIEIVSSKENHEEGPEEEEVEEEEEEWYYEQEIQKEEDNTLSLGSNKAGK